MVKTCILSLMCFLFVCFFSLSFSGQDWTKQVDLCKPCAHVLELLWLVSTVNSAVCPITLLLSHKFVGLLYDCFQKIKSINIFKNSIKYHSYVYFKWFPRHITIAGHSNFLKMYSQCMPASLIRTNKTVKTKPILISSSIRNRRKYNQCLPNKKRKYAHRKMPWELISS